MVRSTGGGKKGCRLVWQSGAAAGVWEGSASRAKDKVIKLQAADYLAYEVRRYAADQFIGSTRPTRETIESLKASRHLAVGFYDAEDLERYIDSRLKAIGVRPL